MESTKKWSAANEEIVREIVLELTKAYEHIINKPGRKIGFVDVFMATSNFSRLLIEDLKAQIERGKFL